MTAAQDCGHDVCDQRAEFHLRARSEGSVTCYAFSCQHHDYAMVAALITHLGWVHGKKRCAIARHRVDADCGMPEAIWDEGLHTCLVPEDWLQVDAVLGPVKAPAERVAEAAKAAATSRKRYREWLRG